MAALAAGQKLRFADLRGRAISAAVLIPLGLVCVRFAPLWDALMILAAAGMLREVRRLGLAYRVSMLGGAAILAAGASLIALRADPVTGYINVLLTAVVVFSGDIGAYAAGRAFAGRKLAPSISPSKTLSGAAGGLAAAMLAAVLVAGDPAAAPAGLLLGFCAQAGDLAESAAKRRAGVKDTGGLIPGHGGLLDRLDGMLGAAPVAGLLAWIAGAGQPLWAVFP